MTAYETLFAGYLDSSGIDFILVGDSAGMVFAGHDTTIPVTMEEMIYHSRSVRRSRFRGPAGGGLALYELSGECGGRSPQCRKAGGEEGGAEAVKIEGGERVLPQVKACVEAGIPVMGHLGMTPQSVNQFGGFRTRGKRSEEAEQLKKDAVALQEAGAFSIVLEKIPAELAGEVTEMLDIPTIGIGAGNNTDGQILVTQDMLGMYEKFKPRFVRRYAELAAEIKSAVRSYADDVKHGRFPDEKESY
ncbi:MAG: 3-methyl-2-oxobutanoate hydroxymethyltransferase [Candidatus Marinimicrobia bacterium]|nr:3-methyl-2-oxobutanoate hydroxymethyltransferase [Candidatus Neomarinimicrobiota bacterium]